MSGFCDLCKVPLELAANRDKLIAQREKTFGRGFEFWCNQNTYFV